MWFSKVKVIADIKPDGSTRQGIKTRSEIEQFVEEPIIKPCQIFYDKNIKTIMSSANKDNIGSEAWIEIDYDTLSSHNKKIAEWLGKLDSKEWGIICRFKMDVPHAGVKIRDIENHFVEVANKFKLQKLLWGYTSWEEQLEFLTKKYRTTVEKMAEQGYTKEKFRNDCGGFYDDKNNICFWSKELYEKWRQVN